ncbi:MAG: zinc ribbon domain-containing protein [Acidobacteria bacterium]|nr:MAG: zinc ribbon domain-containing protein [Acidobacteriota bacterium]REJ98380.1 MAG: zinc ribbon domain-containing protein [Acidobacteriota bacterium]REK17124.1 MAG: zinc ribbon domain-containing protein [Acidobacteriota bacterium]REK43034.1 MAG: zinc ribbon domain-containing protein [Acidobacteriota bacterium]
MFCAKCGTENPDDGSFCRSCGGRIGFVEDEDLTGASNLQKWTEGIFPRKKTRSARYRSGVNKFIWGIFLLIAAVFLGIPFKGNEWWLLALLPGMLMVGWSVADLLRAEIGPAQGDLPETENPRKEDLVDKRSLPPEQTVFAEDEVAQVYETGEVVPSSVTEGTTRDLDQNKKAQTTKLEEVE